MLPVRHPWVGIDEHSPVHELAPHRHVDGVSGLDAAELATFGPVVAKVSRALEQRRSCRARPRRSSGRRPTTCSPASRA